MTCTSCSMTVESALQFVPGVKKAVVALANEEAEIHYDLKIITAVQLMDAVADTGFEAMLISTGEDINRVHLKIDGVLDERLADMVKTSLEALPGVEDATIDAMLQKITVSYKTDQTGPRNFIEVIESVGAGRLNASICPDEQGREMNRRNEIKKIFPFFFMESAFHCSCVSHIHGVYVHPWYQESA
jgi:P-type Cu+ transporter